MTDLTDDEQARIRSELRYAQLVLGSKDAKPQSRVGRILAFASNAFLLAIIGTAFTYFVGPTLQRRYDDHKRRQQVVQDCFTEFMKYSISPFEEYYAVLPLANADQIDDSAFDAYQGKLASLHLKRYEAYARIQGLLSVVGDRPGGAETSAAVKRYAVLVRKFADFTDEWLNQLRCEPHCADDGSDSIGVARRYELMHEALHNLETQEEEPLNRILKLASEQ